jgi:hypothetical protein
MTGLYLEKLRALKSQKGAVGALPKLTKRSPTVEKAQRATADGGFGSFDSALSTAPYSFSARYGRVVAMLEARCPDLVPGDRWQIAIDDGRRLLARWGDRAEALRWTARDLFGLHKPPAQPHPSYRRLSRYDETGLVWLLQGREVVAFTEGRAVIQSSTGALTIYRRHNKPALGPVGDSLDGLEPPVGGSAVRRQF